MKAALLLGVVLAAAPAPGAFAQDTLSTAWRQAWNAVLASTPTAYGALPLVGQASPDFTLKALDGSSVSLHDLKGKVVVLDFFGSRCPPCAKQVPHLNEWLKKHGEAGLVILGVAAIEQQHAVPGFIAQHGVAYPVLLDEIAAVQGQTGVFRGSRVALTLYGIPYIPVLFVVGRDGTLLAHSVLEAGGLTLAQLDDKILGALK